MKRISANVIAVGALIAILAGCSPTAEPTAAPTVAPTVAPSETPSEEPTPAEPSAFTMPEDCLSILPPDRYIAFQGEEVILLAGPGGKYGDELITEPTPEMAAGGMSCYFGVDNEDPNQLEIRVLISVVAIDDASRPGIIADLTALGHLEATDERGDTTFGFLGTSDGQSTANYNVVAKESWISVIEAQSGKKAYFRAIDLANAVHSATYDE